ncbi:MAG: TRZ/ATZ family hydrolase [Acidiferrobacterales bacterium]|nr:TRZ/ATZ family hydrolase [Acidiferrobacterales bacterium]
METVEQILLPEWLIPLSEKEPSSGDPVFTNTAVVIDKGLIKAVGDRDEVLSQYYSDDTLELPNHVVTPGLINAHTHSAMTLLRGYADDLPLMEWLSEHIWPAESKWVNEAFITAGTQLAIAEMLRGGTTCFNDMYFFPDVTASIAERAGIRATVGMIVLDFPTVWANDADEYISKGLAMRDQLRHSALINTAFAPHAPYTVSDKPLERIATLANELDCPIHMHVHETAHEIEESTARFGVRPLERLDQIGLLTHRLAAVHMTQLLPAEIETVASRGVNVVHCPQSNLKLASGLCPVHEMLQAGVNIAIGTDGASSNNDLDMLGELEQASLLAKGASNNPSAMGAFQALYSATMGGAVSLGIDQITGSVEPGKAADLIAIDLSDPSTQPVFNPLSLLVYSASRSQVNHVWVAGKQLLKDRQLTTLDLDEVLEGAKEWGLKIAQNTAS